MEEKSSISLPTEEEREKLAHLFHLVFIELRFLDGSQAKDLAYAFHSIPQEMYGHGVWSVLSIKHRLKHFQDKYDGTIGTDFLKEFSKIFPDNPCS